MSPEPAAGHPYRSGPYQAWAGGEFASRATTFLGRGLHREGPGVPPAMGQWLSAASPPTATMRIPIDARPEMSVKGIPPPEGSFWSK